MTNFTQKNWCQIWTKTCSIRKDDKFYTEKLVSNLEQNMFYTKRLQMLHRQIRVKSGTKHVLYKKIINLTSTIWCQIWKKTCSIRKDDNFYTEKLVSNLEENMFYTKT